MDATKETALRIELVTAMFLGLRAEPARETITDCVAATAHFDLDTLREGCRLIRLNTSSEIPAPRAADLRRICSGVVQRAREGHGLLFLNTEGPPKNDAQRSEFHRAVRERYAARGLEPPAWACEGEGAA